MEQINAKIQQISIKYKELRKAEDQMIKMLIISELKKLCKQALGVLEHHEEIPQTHRKKRQIHDILKKCTEEEYKCAKMELGGGGRQATMSQQQIDTLSKVVASKIVLQQIRSSQLNIKPQQINSICNKMQNNLQVMKDIEQMVIEQGGDLEKIDENIQLAYENTENANKELEEAKEIQHKNRILKIRGAVSGFFGVLGYKILGLPGLIGGLLFGYKGSKKVA